MSRVVRHCAALGIAATLLASCQPAASRPASPGSSAPAPAPPPTASAPAAADTSVSVLHEAARREGKVVWYGSKNLDDASKILPQFEAQYPGVKVEHVRAPGERLVQRLVTEVRGGRTLADAVDINAATLYALVQEGVLEPYLPPAAASIEEQRKDPGGLWYATEGNLALIAWNTNMVRDAEAPQTFEDLADPRWKGKIMGEPDDENLFLTLLKQKYGDEQGVALFRRIAANDVEFHKGRTELADLLAAGQNAICMFCYLHHLQARRTKGAPINWTTREAVENLSVASKIKDGPNPNAGKLFVHWLISDDGQRALASVRDPIPSGITRYPYRPEYSAELDRYRALWVDIFKLR